MSNQEDIFLSNEPLPTSETTVTLDILSEDELLRGNLTQKKILEGKVTFNPRSCLIFFIPPTERTASEPLLTPDRTKWDLYLISIPFTLHEAPGNKYYQEVTFFVELTTPQATAFDLFPDKITTKIEQTKTYTLSPHIKIQETEASLGQIGRRIRFGAIQPMITAFGEGESQFYWVHKGFEEQKQVIPETKQALVVLQVPRGTKSVDATIYVEVVIAKKMLGRWVNETGTVDTYPIRWPLQEAPSFSVPDTSHITSPKVSTRNAHFDVCIVCALPDEARAFIHETERQYGATFQRAYSPLSREYSHTSISNKRGEPLSIHVSWQPGYGPVEAGLHIKPVLQEFKPRFAAMTGICAGDKTKVRLGDIIVAERAFAYDTGKMVAGKDRRQEHLHDMQTQQPHIDLLQFVRMFDAWQAIVANIPRPSSKHQQRDWLLSKLLEKATPRVDDIDEKELEKHAPDWKKIVRALWEGPNPFLTQDRKLLDPSRVVNLRFAEETFPFQDPPQPKLHIAPMASGNTVRSDSPFDEVRIPVRGTVAIDMEGATFYRTVAEFPKTHSLLVKGVCDYADSDKDDSYHEYASAVSAAYMLSFIREYVTAERIPIYT